MFLTDDHGLSTLNLKVVHVYHQSERNNLPQKIICFLKKCVLLQKGFTNSFTKGENCSRHGIGIGITDIIHVNCIFFGLG